MLCKQIQIFNPPDLVGIGWPTPVKAGHDLIQSRPRQHPAGEVPNARGRIKPTAEIGPAGGTISSRQLLLSPVGCEHLLDVCRFTTWICCPHGRSGPKPGELKEAPKRPDRPSCKPGLNSLIVAERMSQTLWGPICARSSANRKPLAIASRATESIHPSRHPLALPLSGLARSRRDPPRKASNNGPRPPTCHMRWLSV